MNIISGMLIPKNGGCSSFCVIMTRMVRVIRIRIISESQVKNARQTILQDLDSGDLSVAKNR